MGLARLARGWGGGARELPGNFEDSDAFTKAFDDARRQFHAGFGQIRVVVLQRGMGAFANEDMAVAGQAFETAGEVHLPAEDSIIDDMLA